MTDNDANSTPEMPSPDDLSKMLEAMMGGGGLGGDGLGDIDPDELMKMMGGSEGAPGGLGGLEALLGGGGGMADLTRMMGGGGMERMMADMMSQFESQMPAAANPADVIEAGHTTAITLAGLAELDDQALVAQLVNHAQSHLVNAIADPDNATLSDEIDVMQTFPAGQLALLITTRAIGTIKMDGLEKFATRMVAQDARFLTLSADGFRKLECPELAIMIEKAHLAAAALNKARAEGAGYDVTDDLVDELSDMDDEFAEYDFFALHQHEIAFIRAHPTLFVDHEAD